MQTLTETVARVGQLARDFHTAGSRSPDALFESSGYREQRRSVGEAQLADYFAHNPELVDHWLIYSSDKRCDGWYLCEDADGAYRLGCFPSERSKQERRFTSRVEACAAYVKIEMESFAKQRRIPHVVALPFWLVGLVAKALWRKTAGLVRRKPRDDDGYVGHC